MWTKESVGELVLESLEQTFNDLIILSYDSDDVDELNMMCYYASYELALTRYELAKANALSYVETLNYW